MVFTTFLFFAIIFPIEGINMNRLSIPRKEEIGLELEVNGIKTTSMYNILSEFPKYEVQTDNSILYTGSEIATPILHNKAKELDELKRVLLSVSSVPHNFEDCSLQINFDYSLIKKDKNLEYFLKIFAIFEDIIYHYSIGSAYNFRDSIDTYASPIRNYLITYLNSNLPLKYLVEHFSNNKRDAICIKNNKDKYNKTILEYRSINGTLDYEEIMDYINFFYYLTISYRRIDKEKIDYIFSNLNPMIFLESYFLKKMKKAKEFAELVFPKEKDKNLFLTRYENINYRK